MNRRDLFKGFAAAGVTVIAAKAGALESPALRSAIAKPKPIITDSFIDGSMTIDLEQVRDWRLIVNENLRHQHVMGQIEPVGVSVGFRDRQLDVVLSPPMDVYNDLVTMMDNCLDIRVIHAPSVLDCKARIDQLSVSVGGMDRDVLIELSMRLLA